MGAIRRFHRSDPQISQIPQMNRRIAHHISHDSYLLLFCENLRDLRIISLSMRSAEHLLSYSKE